MNASDHNVKKLILAVCKAYDIGHYNSDITICAGGLQHTIYQFTTNTGQFIIKILNPNIINHPNLKDRYRITEAIAHTFSKYISAICAITHHDDPIFIFENDITMLFPYVNGKILLQNEITSQHILKLAYALACIHKANITHHPVPEVEIPKKIGNFNLPFENQIKQKLIKTLPVINDICEQCENNITILKNNTVISHRDLDPKNVLWNDNNYYIIDWESVGLINRTKDLLTTALYWCFDDHYQVNLDSLVSFITIYQKNCGLLLKDEIEPALNGFLGDWISWLDFNLNRMLNNSNESHEYLLGMKEASKTLQAIPIVYQQFPTLIKELKKTKLS